MQDPGVIAETSTTVPRIIRERCTVVLGMVRSPEDIRPASAVAPSQCERGTADLQQDQEVMKP